MTKLTNYEKHFRAKMKDKNFNKGYKQECHRLEVAYKIVQLRAKKHLSQQGLAKKIGTTQSVIARMEAGRQNFTTDNLQRIASVFNKRIKIEFVS
ncbi:helix-turn-helix domain-containing protein [Patescibacteria group bacterium]|nr:helix-turn-helix domain-containing protein [Patescibacteria group bacterium]MBU4162068.1 helix-turn-helix domain-containing protein [Patescibacteria group bacterium]